jgi:hypothetical protein
VSISIVLYSVPSVENVNDLHITQEQIQQSDSVNLYKITEDLCIIFNNSTEPYEDTEALPYKAIFGNFVNVDVGDITVNGFVSTAEVSKICDWIKENEIEKFDGFSKIYNSISEDAMQLLREIGSDPKEALFAAYVKPLTDFYFKVFNDKSAIIVCGQ